MTTDEWNEKFGEEFVITLTDEERRYFALNPINPAWETAAFYSKSQSRHTRITAYFDGDTLVKVIRDLKFDMSDYREYTEYDTSLATENHSILLPLTSRGKPKPITVINLDPDTIMPFGCSLWIFFNERNGTRIHLTNRRANKDFPIGEWDRIAAIRSEEDFHIFADYYISTCREDYFDKLNAFRSAKKVRVKCKPGDIFRMEYGRTHYCYGIITGDTRQLKTIPELPEKHSLRPQNFDFIQIRLYRLITENPNLRAEELRRVPLGQVKRCYNFDIAEGRHTIVDHKQIEPDDLEFDFVCAKIWERLHPRDDVFTQDILMRSIQIPNPGYSLFIEWGFAQTILPCDRISDKLKELTKNYETPHSGCSFSIDPRDAVPDYKRRMSYGNYNNLLNPENREFLNEIFACLGLGEDTTFDQFADKFGGLTLREIAARMADQKR